MSGKWPESLYWSREAEVALWQDRSMIKRVREKPELKVGEGVDGRQGPMDTGEKLNLPKNSVKPQSEQQ